MSAAPRRRTTGSFVVRGKNPRTTGKHPVQRLRRWRSLASLGIALLALSGCVVALHYGWQALRDSSRLRVQRLEVNGNERAAREALLSLAGLSRGQPILDIDLDGAAAAMRRHPWVKQAGVRRRLPDCVVVDVTEYQPAIVVALGDLYLADNDGVIFKRLVPEDRVVSPIVTGLSRESHDPSLARKLVSDALAVLRALKQTAASFGRLEELNWDADLGWSLVVRPDSYRQGPARLRLGRDPVSRVDAAERALERLTELGREAEVIDAGLATPQRVHARLRTGMLTRGSTPSTLIATAR